MKMKLTVKILFAALLLTFTGSTFANNTSLVNTYKSAEDRNLSGFHAVSLSGSFDYYISQGSTESVKVEASAKLLPNIITEVKNGVLKVYTKSNIKWNLFDNEDVVIRITVKDINSLELSGSGDVFFKGGLNAANLRVALSGSGDITGKVNAKNLESSITGSGDLNLSGRAETSRVSVVGSGDFSGRDLITVNTQVKVVGSGDADVYVNGRLDASVSGSGDIHYNGGAKNINKSIAGSGEISGQ